MNNYNKYLKYKIKYNALRDTLTNYRVNDNVENIIFTDNKNKYTLLKESIFNNMHGGNFNLILDKLPAKSVVYVGYYIGSFSPIHNGHVDIMNKFKAKLEKLGVSSSNILGIISLNSDDHLKTKKIKIEDNMNIILRTELVKSAFSDWIDVVNFKAYPSNLINNILSPLYNYKDKIRFIFYEISGSDDTIKHNKWVSPVRSNNNRLYTCFRAGEPESSIDKIKQEFIKVTSDKGYPLNTIDSWYITSFSDVDVSSSKIRSSINKGNVDYLIKNMPTSVIAILSLKGPWVKQLSDNKNSITLSHNSPLQVLEENKRKYGEMESGIKNNEVRPTGMLTTMGIPSMIGKINPGDEINTTIYFMDTTTNNSILYFNKKQYNVTILNFANANYVCGGVEQGSLAQEEELCRTSMMLYNSLQQFTSGVKEIVKNNDGSIRYDNDGKIMKRYKYNNWNDRIWYEHILFTPNIIFRRMDGTNKPAYDEVDEYSSNVITAAAPNFGRWSFDGNNFTNKHIRIPQNTIMQQLRTVIETVYYAPTLSYDDIKYNRRKIDWKEKPLFPEIEKLMPKTKSVLILGAFGCGAFRPSNGGEEYSKFMAEQFSYVLKNIKKKYDIICFAIMKDARNKNYIIFKDVLMKNFKVVEIIN